MTVYHSPCGDLLLACSGGRLCLCDWVPRKDRNRVNGRVREVLGEMEGTEPGSGKEDVIAEAARQLDLYFQGRLRQFDLPLALAGTPFQKRVWEALLSIPYGTTVTYADIASRLGSPSAVRAVAGAIGANAISIIIPCHRVIGSGGRLTGYAGGLEAKRYLLNLEITDFQASAVP